MQGMNSRTQTPGAHVTNYTHDTAGFLTVASLLSTSHLDWETRGQEKITRAVFPSKTPALLGRVLSKTQLGSHAESEDKPDQGSFPTLAENLPQRFTAGPPHPPQKLPPSRRLVGWAGRARDSRSWGWVKPHTGYSGYLKILGGKKSCHYWSTPAWRRGAVPSKCPFIHCPGVLPFLNISCLLIMEKYGERRVFLHIKYQSLEILQGSGRHRSQLPGWVRLTRVLSLILQVESSPNPLPAPLWACRANQSRNSSSSLRDNSHFWGCAQRAATHIF